jgi:hypothetical protein
VCQVHLDGAWSVVVGEAKATPDIWVVSYGQDGLMQPAATYTDVASRQSGNVTRSNAAYIE